MNFLYRLVNVCFSMTSTSLFFSCLRQISNCSSIFSMEG